MSELFGALRSLLDQPIRDESWASALIELAKDARDESEELYAEQWLPYLAEHSDSWPDPLGELYDLEMLEEHVALLPNAWWTLDVDSWLVGEYGMHDEDAFESEREHFTALMNSPSAARLSGLNLEGVSMGDAGVIELVASAYLTNLTHLYISYTGVGDDGVVALAASPNVERLRVLGLAECEFEERGLRALASSPHLRALESIDLRNGLYGSSYAQDLLSASTQLPNLTRIFVGDD